MTTVSTSSNIAKKVTRLPSVQNYLNSLIKKELTVTDYVQACLKNYDAFENQVHAWVNFDRAQVLERAAKLDELLDSNRTTTGKSFSNQFYGVPVGIKDIFNTLDYPTEHGSPIFKGYTPGNDARVVTNIRRSNGIIFGKTRTAELAVHTPGPTKNPLDVNRTPGTSSSGSASAVASGMVPLALASQTSGSTIRPAGYCGIIGYKPSFGVLPRTAMLKTTDTLDTVGIMGTYLSDILSLFNLIKVEGANYPIVAEKLHPYKKLGQNWKVGIIQNHYKDFESCEVSSELQTVSRHLADNRCNIAVVELPKLFDNSLDIHTLIYHKALSYYFKREWDMSPELFSNALSNIMIEGNSISVKAYQESCAIQVQYIREFEKIFDEYDILMCASSATEAPFSTDENIPPDYNHLITMCHTPSITLPLMRVNSGMPTGVQFITKRYHDYKLFDFCDFVTNITSYES